MSLFLRIFQHLLPDAAPWRLTVQTTLRSFFEGLTGTFSDARQFVDEIYEDLWPETTRALTEWENQYGLEPNPDEATRRLNLAAELAASGGQSPSYIQGVLRTAGFDVYVHEWWASGPPYVARDPHDYVADVLLGSIQCGEALAQCGEPLAECNNVLVSDPLYLVNEDLTQRAPPPIPADEATWPYFWYVGAETFPVHAEVPEERKAEFKRLLMKLGPSHLWVVTLIDYV